MNELYPSKFKIFIISTEKCDIFFVYICTFVKKVARYLLTEKKERNFMSFTEIFAKNSTFVDIFTSLHLHTLGWDIKIKYISRYLHDECPTSCYNIAFENGDVLICLSL